MFCFSEGPGNEENLSDDERGGNKEKSNVSRVNPLVAARLDGLRKRKLATLDSCEWYLYICILHTVGPNIYIYIEVFRTLEKVFDKYNAINECYLIILIKNLYKEKRGRGGLRWDYYY